MESVTQLFKLFVKSDKNQCLKYTDKDLFYEHCLVSSQIAITHDFQQKEAKKRKTSHLGMKDNIRSLKIKIS